MIVRTGVANTASVCAALARCGMEPRITDDAREIERAPRLILPGVGAFGAGMRAIEAARIAWVLRARIADGRPTLAICLGMQLLGAGSDESPGVEGLGVIDAAAARFPPGVRMPQFGWNRVTPAPGCTLVRAGHAYFANSYRFTDTPSGWAPSTADHGGTFLASIERGRVLACQFHPELSGSYGLDLIRRWLVSAEASIPC
jgi:imidazole glycerol phosphate synthase glutamine amidotransferase subunit